MRIVIVGMGKFGKILTEHLVKEDHDILVIDTNPTIIEDVVNQFDVKGFSGNGASYGVQEEAEVKDADVLIASTGNDEMNILCCLVAKKIGVSHTIARIRNPEYSLQARLMSKELGVDLTCNPDEDTAMEISRILRFPQAIKVDTFANGKVDLVEIKVDAHSPLKNKSLIQIHTKYQIHVLVCAVKRGDDVIIPSGDFILREGDDVYLTSSSKEMVTAFRKLGIFSEKLKSVMIIGGGRITYYLVPLLLANRIHVKIIENNHESCLKLSQAFPRASIIYGDGTNQKLLREEGLESVDCLIALTGMDETNMIVSAFSKSLKCPKVITKVNRSQYDIILNRIGLESIVSPKEVFSASIIRYVRGMESSHGSEFKTLYRLVNNRVEALEFLISEKTDFTGIPLKKLKIKKNFLIASIIRRDEVIIPSGESTIEPFDSVVIITASTFVKDVSDILE